MADPSFNEVYPRAAELYRSSGLDIEAVAAVYGGRADWPTLRGMLLGTDGTPPHSVPRDPSHWYSVHAEHEYWPAQLDLLIKRKQWDDSSVQSLDIASSKVVNHLFDPSEPGEQSRHGLVIGHIQSGKTASFTAVVAKAADAGYNLVIVLTGLYNDLRDQTQSRLSKELCGSVKDQRGHHVDGDLYSVAWREETSGSRDFHNLEWHPAPDPAEPTIAVIKKNVSPLESVLEWVDGFGDELKQTLNVLIIDDEADHASVNTMTGEEIDEETGEPENSPSAINRLLRSLIKRLPRVAYVGYTATAFANVFIDPDESDEELGLTLYPKDFIVSLPKPRGHVGLEDIFTCEPVMESPPHVVIVPQDEADDLRAMTTDDQPTRAVPPSLQEAIMDYLLTGAVRVVRGEKNFHHTMMVHTKHTLDAMTPLVRRVREIIRDFEQNLPRTSSKRGKDLEADFLRRWEEEFVAKGCAEDWADVRLRLMEFILHATPKILEINMGGGDSLEFDRYKAKGLKAIAIGGNRLSRGLTLEGLCISFFIRPTSTHDTLMQMSRWSGFREHHLDLVRVHVTADIFERFTGMIGVERELRDDLERYEAQTELTPLDFGVRVLRQEDTTPTRPGARRNVRTIDTGGTEEQSVFFTGRFDFDDENKLEENLSALAEFVQELGAPRRVGGKEETILWRDIGPEKIEQFIDELEYPEQGTWPVDRILSHIERRVEAGGGELSSWRFAMIGLQAGVLQCPLADYGLDELSLVLPQRTRLAGLNSVGMMPGPWDFIVDLPNRREEFQTPGGTGFNYNRMWERRPVEHPLLLAYVIDKASSPKPSFGRSAAKPRTSLFREGETPVHVLGLALAFPQANLTAADRARQRTYWIRASAEPFPGLP